MKNNALAKEILARVEKEQEVRKAAIGGKAKHPEYKALDKKNTAWLKRVIKKEGWPTVSLVGKKAANGAWLLVQHADQDVDFQKNVLKLIKKIYKKTPEEVSKMRIAYLTDRILHNEGKPLMFGIMYRTNGTEVTPMPIRDAKNVEKRRKEYGITVTVEDGAKRLSRELKRLGAKRR